MRVSKRYVTITGKEKIYQYDYECNHIRKRRMKCPHCSDYMTSVYYKNVQETKVGWVCRTCNTLFINGVVDKVFRVKVKEWENPN